LYVFIFNINVVDIKEIKKIIQFYIYIFLHVIIYKEFMQRVIRLIIFVYLIHSAQFYFLNNRASGGSSRSKKSRF